MAPSVRTLIPVILILILGFIFIYDCSAEDVYQNITIDDPTYIIHITHTPTQYNHKITNCRRDLIFLHGSGFETFWEKY
jgi:hypothetical protein